MPTVICAFLPSADAYLSKLYRVFPISHSYYFSKLLFSPDSSKASHILIGKEVHSAAEYNRCTAPFLGRQMQNALLKFSIFDETVHKTSSVTASESSQAWTDRSTSDTMCLPPQVRGPIARFGIVTI
jgi:next-to-BRCA1 protein 1